MKKTASVFVVAALCAACGGNQTESPEAAVAAENPATAAAPAAPARPAAPRFREVTIPEGTALPLSLQSAVAAGAPSAALAVSGLSVCPPPHAVQNAETRMTLTVFFTSPPHPYRVRTQIRC